MLICPQRKFIFFKPMKCAGSSVEHALLKTTDSDALCTGADEYPEKNNQVFHDNEWYARFHQHTWPGAFYDRIANPAMYEDYTNITIVRNPWDMIVSYYWFCMGGDLKNVHLENASDWVIRKEDSKTVVKEKFNFIMTAATAYDSVSAHELGITNQAASPFIFISMVNSKFLDKRVHRYLRYEDIKTDFLGLCSDLSLGSVELPRHKSGFRKLDLHYSEYYNDWMIEEVKYYFGDYIEKFGYEFESC